ncbi:MAG: hypothetical protein M3Q55_01595 [Acidobacteriota bacterium]|nr:hypothetical protein [Acidobacteriota bacterium]
MKAVLRRTSGSLLCLALLMGVTACETAKSESPLSPTIAGPLEGVVLTAPKALEPLANQQIKDKDQPFTVIIENAVTTSPRPFVMRMQIATDANFASVAWTRDGITPGENNRTSFRMPERLQPGRNYFWRVMADDGANQSEWSAPREFEILRPTKFGAPTPREPRNNEQISSTKPELKVANGSAEGPVGQAYYLFQVSDHSSFSSLKVNEETPQHGGGETKLRVPGTLKYSTTYYWRARISDGETTSAWSEIESFRTADPPPPTPDPAPGPGPDPTACGAPYPSTPISIIKCQRSQFGHMSSGQIVQFLINSAKDLTARGISGAPFGIAVKTGGHNCLGFSCDILCSGDGSSQRQWDVLGDADGDQVPTWGEVSNVAVRTCQIQ